MFKNISGAVTGIKMENFSALDPRKQELLEARFLGGRVRTYIMIFYFLLIMIENILL